MHKNNLSSDLEVRLHNDEVKATDSSPNWKDGLTLEIFMTFCLVGFIAFIFVAIIFRLYNQ
ncbi:MAG TPA: hypothetical protein VGC12_08260 [Methyloradius sp.]